MPWLLGINMHYLVENKWFEAEVSQIMPDYPTIKFLYLLGL